MKKTILVASILCTSLLGYTQSKTTTTKQTPTQTDVPTQPVKDNPTSKGRIKPQVAPSSTKEGNAASTTRTSANTDTRIDEGKTTKTPTRGRGVVGPATVPPPPTKSTGTTKPAPWGRGRGGRGMGGNPVPPPPTKKTGN